MLAAHGLSSHPASAVRSIGGLRRDDRLVFRARDSVLLDETRVALQMAWSETSHQLQALRDNPDCARQEFERIADVEDPGMQPKVRAELGSDGRVAFAMRSGAGAVRERPSVAILREQGVNGQSEMAAAFHQAGFRCHDVHMSDLFAGRRKLDEFDGRSLPAWLYGITRKTVSDYRRRAWLRRLLHGVTRSLDTAPPEAGAILGVDAVERLEAQRILRRVVAQMSQVRRTAFILFEIEGYSGEEIAALEQIPIATVYTRLHHARKDFLRLTAQLTGQEPEEPPS